MLQPLVAIYLTCEIPNLIKIGRCDPKIKYSKCSHVFLIDAHFRSDSMHIFIVHILNSLQQKIAEYHFKISNRWIQYEVPNIAKIGLRLHEI